MPRWRPLLYGSIASIAVNVGLYALARSAGGFGPDVIAISAGAPITAEPIAVASFAGVVGGALARAGLGVALRRPAARASFLAVAALLLVASFVSPISGVAGAGLAEVAALEVMHVTTAVIGVLSVESAFRPAWGWGRAPWVARDAAPTTAFVSGATSGIGAEVALALAARGWRVFGVGRSAAKARAVERRADGMRGSLSIGAADLSLVAACDAVAEEAHRQAPEGFSVVVHCVGTLKPRSEPTAEGIDGNIAASWLARVALTERLRLAPGARVVNVAAAEHGRLPAALRVPLAVPADLGTGMQAHGRAQLANDLWTAGLARGGVGAWGYGPGAVDTEIRRELPAIARWILAPWYRAETRSPADAAADIVRVALDRDLPAAGFASRDGVFEHDAFVRDPDRQHAVSRLAATLLEQARSGR